MSASASPILKTSPSQSSAAFMHGPEEVCPLCEQQIPHDQFDEIRERIETRLKKSSAEIATRLQEQFALEKAQALEQASKEAEKRTSLAREEGRKAAEAAALEQIAANEAASQEALQALQTRAEEAEAAKVGAEELRGALQAQLAQVQLDSQATIDAIKQEALVKEETIRAEAKVAADAAVKDRLVSAEAAKLEAERAGKNLKEQLDQVTAESVARIQELNDAAAAREAEIRQEAAVAAEAAAQQKIADLEQARLDAEAKAAAAEKQVVATKEAEETKLHERLQEQREALEQDKTAAVNAEKAAAFEENLKLSETVAKLTRALEKRSNDELGEGAEINLFEALKGEFEGDGDRIVRINKGQPGADILHTVVHNGKECGTIIYDSKNHGAWRGDFVTQLATNQMAAKAEHAILSTSKFPSGTRELHQLDGIILASPARVVAVVQLIRQHLVQTHALRLSTEEKTQKTAALYAFITSARYADILKRIDIHADDLLDIQLKEKKAHETTWRRQGELIRSVQKVRAELTKEIDVIIGTADDEEQPDE